MTTELKNALKTEIEFINEWNAYPDSELEPITNIDDAMTQIEGMELADDFPEGLKNPETLMLVWNYCLDVDNARRKAEEESRMNRKYLVRYTYDDGEKFAIIQTPAEIAQYYETDQIASIYRKIEVYDIESEPRKIDYLDLVCPILEQKRWMEQEYRDYCENERY